jgi:hypothetical protein
MTLTRDEAPSTPRLLGPHMLSALRPPLLHKSDAKLPPWPNTRSATVSVFSGSSNSNTRLLLKSATYKLPAASSVSPSAKQRLLAPTPPRLHVLDAKLPPCPSTRGITLRLCVCSESPDELAGYPGRIQAPSQASRYALRFASVASVAFQAPSCRFESHQERHS